ncbi:hypothetical protein L4D76_08320 [Photobacterium sagamiensis]|uniref:hypothetical protein n=1 Tax=Photobacterium sagamiensis TaxID=2910241 RepID=UPI003D09B553
MTEQDKVTSNIEAGKQSAKDAMETLKSVDTKQEIEKGKEKFNAFSNKVKAEAGTVDLKNLDINALKEKKSLLIAVAGGVVALFLVISILFGGGGSDIINATVVPDHQIKYAQELGDIEIMGVRNRYISSKSAEQIKNILADDTTVIVSVIDSKEFDLRKMKSKDISDLEKVAKVYNKKLKAMPDLFEEHKKIVRAPIIAELKALKQAKVNVENNIKAYEEEMKAPKAALEQSKSVKMQANERRKEIELQVRTAYNKQIVDQKLPMRAIRKNDPPFDVRVRTTACKVSDQNQFVQTKTHCYYVFPNSMLLVEGKGTGIALANAVEYYNLKDAGKAEIKAGEAAYRAASTVAGKKYGFIENLRRTLHEISRDINTAEKAYEKSVSEWSRERFITEQIDKEQLAVRDAWTKYKQSAFSSILKKAKEVDVVMGEQFEVDLDNAYLLSIMELTINDKVVFSGQLTDLTKDYSNVSNLDISIYPPQLGNNKQDVVEYDLLEKIK